MQIDRQMMLGSCCEIVDKKFNQQLMTGLFLLQYSKVCITLTEYDRLFQFSSFLILFLVCEV